MKSTNLLKSRLIDGLFSERDYASFLKKHSLFIEKVLGTRYSSKKYTDVDIKGIFYTDFNKFLCDDLKKLPHDIRLTMWENSVITKRANSIQKNVEEEAVKVLLKKGGVDNNYAAFSLLLENYADVLCRVVSRCYDGNKYKGKREEIVKIIKHLFLIYRLTGRCTSVKIDKLEGWFYKILYNFAINKKTREQIDKELSVDHYDTNDIDTNRGLEDEPQDQIIDEVPENGAEELDYDDSNKSLDDLSNESLLVLEDILLESDYTAEGKIKHLLKLMPNKEYADIIRAIAIEGVEREVIAEEKGINLQALYLRYEDAMIMLMSVALPQIQNVSRHVYAKSRWLIKKEDDLIILDQFFRDQKTISEMAKINMNTERNVTERIVKGFKHLLKLYSKQLKEDEKGRLKDFDKRIRQENEEYEESYKQLMS